MRINIYAKYFLKTHNEEYTVYMMLAVGLKDYVMLVTSHATTCRPAECLRLPPVEGKQTLQVIPQTTGTCAGT